MSKKLLHTPEGVRDVYGEEYTRRIMLEEKVHEKFHLFGYHDIKTPTFEFFDVFSREIGTTPSKDLYKFFDKEGNTLVLRPDFTPSIARCAAKYYMDETLPVRFCYSGNRFTNRSDLQGKLKEETQMGVELIGDDSIAADAEMITLLIETLLNTGLKDFQVSIGQVEFFKGMCEAAGLDEDVELSLREYISNKNYFAAENLLTEKNVAEGYKQVLLEINDLFGSADILMTAKRLANNPRSMKAVERLQQLDLLLRAYDFENYVSYDFGLLSKYNYYTGVVFKAYTYGVGDAIVQGGRYDTLLSQFGKNAPAIGFAVTVDDLENAIRRQKIQISSEEYSTCLVYLPECYEKALSVTRFLRNDGMPVEMVAMKPYSCACDYISFAKDRQHTILMSVEQEKSARMINVLTGEEKYVPVESISLNM